VRLRRSLAARFGARRTLDPEDLAVLVDGGDALCLPCDRDIRNEFFLMGCATESQRCLDGSLSGAESVMR